MTDNDPPNDGDGIAAAEGNIPAPQESDFVEYSIEDKPPPSSRYCWGSSTTSR